MTYGSVKAPAKGELSSTQLRCFAYGGKIEPRKTDAGLTKLLVGLTELLVGLTKVLLGLAEVLLVCLTKVLLGLAEACYS